MISMARTLGAPETVPAGQRRTAETSTGPRPSSELAGNLRGEVHHVAVALDGHQLVDPFGTEAGDPADVVAGEVDEHDVLGELLRVLDELGLEPAVLLVVRAAAGASRRSALTRRARRAPGPSAQARHRPPRRPPHGGRTCTGWGSPGGAPDRRRTGRSRGRSRNAATGRPGRRHLRGCAPWRPRRPGGTAQRWSPPHRAVREPGIG